MRGARPPPTLRAAETRDARALSALAIETYCDAFGHSLSPTDLASHVAQNLSEAHVRQLIEVDVVLLAELDARLIGYVQFGALAMPVAGAIAGARELRRLYVHPDCQNRGYGNLLMEAALAHPELRRAPAIYLDVWERNLAARRFYERYRFAVVGARDFEVASGAETDADLIMVRTGG